ncbi:four helix bundle protein [Portibacter marinus]|uniref:four helix bundle protein n=1 Tax=Portibacter marinus TaxID=2898660 RepID=UPI001F2E23DD|nr:four helix bundle protein [Portibacter marinus]
MRNFRKLRIWWESKDLALEIYRISADFPKEEKFGLVSQMRRCSISICSNIAEGCSRETETNFAYYLSISMGSAFELETQLMICRDLKYIRVEDFRKIFEMLNKLQRGISSLRVKVIA